MLILDTKLGLNSITYPKEGSGSHLFTYVDSTIRSGGRRSGGNFHRKDPVEINVYCGVGAEEK